jgi:hypothetical protein
VSFKRIIKTLKWRIHRCCWTKVTLATVLLTTIYVTRNTFPSFYRRTDVWIHTYKTGPIDSWDTLRHNASLRPFKEAFTSMRMVVSCMYYVPQNLD